MTRLGRAVTTELVAIGCVALYNVAVPRLSRRARIPANVGAAVALAGLARVAGVRPRELGLEPATLRRGARAGLLAAAPIALASTGAVVFPRSRAMLADEAITTTTIGEAAFETLVRIPIETALAEELIFRGVLLALGLRTRSRGWAIATSSVLFGLWHVVPTLGALARGAGGGPGGRVRTSVATTVATTTAAGAGFSLLRLYTGSLAAPIVAHATVNMVAFAGVRATAIASIAPSSAERSRRTQREPRPR